MTSRRTKAQALPTDELVIYDGRNSPDFADFPLLHLSKPARWYYAQLLACRAAMNGRLIHLAPPCSSTRGPELAALAAPRRPRPPRE